MVAAYLADNLLEAACSAFGLAGNLHLPSLGLDVLAVHAEEVAGKDGRLVSSGTATYLKYGVLLVLRVGRDEQQLYVLLHLRQFRFYLGYLVLGHLPEIFVLLVGNDVLGHFQLLYHHLVFLPRLDHGSKLLVLLVQLHIFLHIRNHIRIGKLCLERVVFFLKAKHLRQQ